MPHHFILIRADRTVTGGNVVEYTHADLAEIYTPDEQARLARGQRVQRDGFHHVDLQAAVVAQDLADRQWQALVPDDPAPAKADCQPALFLRHRAPAGHPPAFEALS